jgi:DNA-binding IclR family transcriptional regulator
MIRSKKIERGVNHEIKKKGLSKSKSHFAFQEGGQSVHRAIRLLRRVAESNEQGIRLSQIAKKMDLPVTTAHRILNVLVSEGFLEYDPISKCYHIGIELYSLGSKAQRFALREKYRSCLENVARETLDSVYLVIRSSLDALCIDDIEGKSTIRIMAYNLGSRRPLGIGAGSLALLAFSPDDEIESILKANELRYQQNNKMTVSKVRGLIKQTRKLGYAFNEGHFMKGINAVGVPVYNDQGDVVAAISVGSISERIDRVRSKEIAEFIKSEISFMRPFYNL